MDTDPTLADRIEARLDKAGSKTLRQQVLVNREDLRAAAVRLRKLDDPEKLARRFHEAYERLAPSFGYETREASAVPWDEVPENNRALMIAAVADALGGTE